ncbi:hypothetical protein F4775DRAFT_589442 [Biscogniauxia sp. FL1348]|nr:hypothetical protein F4775DRAFT_589442 [Biscogniauxia sp. FL1348]
MVIADVQDKWHVITQPSSCDQYNGIELPPPPIFDDRGPNRRCECSLENSKTASDHAVDPFIVEIFARLYVIPLAVSLAVHVLLVPVRRHLVWNYCSYLYRRLGSAIRSSPRQTTVQLPRLSRQYIDNTDITTESSTSADMELDIALISQRAHAGYSSWDACRTQPDLQEGIKPWFHLQSDKLNAEAENNSLQETKDDNPRPKDLPLLDVLHAQEPSTKNRSIYVVEARIRPREHIIPQGMAVIKERKECCASSLYAPPRPNLRNHYKKTTIDDTYTNDELKLRWNCCDCGNSNNSYELNSYCTSCFENPDDNMRKMIKIVLNNCRTRIRHCHTGAYMEAEGDFFCQT